MKLQHSLLAAALLAAVSTSAVAQSSGVVTLGGTIVPSTCTMTFAGGDVANLGDIDYATVLPTGNLQLPNVDMPLTVTCSGPTMASWTITDNRHGTSTQVNNYSLGLNKTTGNVNIGRYVVVIQNPMLDGAASAVIQSSNLSTWSSGAGLGWDKMNTGSGNRYKALGTPAAGPQPFMNASLNLAVVTYLNSRNNLQLTQSEAIDGNATIELVYL